MTATLGQLIRERRMELNLTQEELAERVGDGVRQSEISRLERNRVTLPRRRRMEQIAEALDIPVGILLARSGWVGAETIEELDVHADGREADDGVVVGAEPVVVAPDAIAPMHDDEASGTLPAGFAWTASVPDYSAYTSVENPELHEAIERAELLIADSEATMHQAQTTVEQARIAARRRLANRAS